MKKNHIILAFLLSVTTNTYSMIVSQVTINPIQICSTDGTVCANPSQTLFEAEMDKIYAQAGIDIIYNAFSQVNNSSFLSLNYDSSSPSSSEAFDFLGTERPAQDNTPEVINMWFVQSLPPSTSIYGLGLIGQDGILITDKVFTDSRIDTLAHEVAHNLGLEHPDALGPDYLISEGSSRNRPTTLADITNDGVTGTSLLSAQDLVTIGGSNYVVDLANVTPPNQTPVSIPSSIYLLGFGLLFGLRRRIKI